MSLPHIDDLITDLPPLQLEHALPTSEQSYLALRLQSRAFLLSALAQCRYLVHTWRLLKENCPLKKMPSKSSYTSLPSLPRTAGTFSIGIIGCGRMGRHIVNKLLLDPLISPEMILISTRQPDLLEEFTSQGVNCRFDNVWLANHVDIIFLTCLPSHLSHVVKDLYKSSVSHACLLVSLLAGVSSARVRRALNTRTNVTSIYFDWNQLGTESRTILSENLSPEVRLSSRALCVSGCPYVLGYGTWLGEIVLSCLSNCAVHGIAAREAGDIVQSLLVDVSSDVASLIPGPLMEKRGVLRCREDEGYWSENFVKLSEAIVNEKLRDALVEKFFQRVREREPSLLDLASQSASTKSL